MHTIESMQIQVEEQAEAIVVRIAGDAGLQSIDTLQSHLNRLIAKRAPLVVFDLSELRFVSSLAMGAFVEFNRGMVRNGCAVRLAALQPLVFKAFQHAMLDTVLEIRASVESALAG
jgi:anti-anti-sigma factor